ncbi:class I adenylate-forming enzyme family protein [Aeromicrobium sp. CF4.19]|uniref:class I adenylate-forming enzyme family protein n=1 Tax=Aeromicrobium sp. CF4.19 TaxID=3373082 RepID=UPI003EE5EA41
MLRNTAVAHGDRAAVVAPDGIETWSELYERACRLANGLRDVGIVPGDRVAVLGDNSSQLLECVAACALGGFPRASLYPYHSAEVNAYLLDLIDTRVMIVEAQYLENLRPLLVDRPHLRVIAIDAAGSVVQQHQAAVGYEDLIAASSATDPMVPIDDDAPHIIRFSSGTTGRPKGIWHSSARWRGQSTDFAAILPTMDERDRFLAAGSLTHVAVGNLWQIIQTGASVLPMAPFDAGEALRLIEEHRLTYAAAAPIMIKAMVEHPDAARRDLSSMRCIWYAGSPIAEATLERAVVCFGDALYQVYGQSESSPMSVLRPHEHPMERGSRRHRSAGRPQPNMEISIVDDDGRRLPTGTVGEVAARSHGTMSGIWGDPQGTASRTLDDGSIRTRDVGFLDEEGYLHLVDRKDDMIVSGGYNIWPAELEQALVEHPAVREACVVGVPDERWGETPLAAVVLVQNMPRPTTEELIMFVRDRVGGYKKPSYVEFVRDLPRTGTGKVLRRLLRDQHVPREAGSIVGS